MRGKAGCWIVFAVLFAAGESLADVPWVMNFSGRLGTAAGDFSGPADVTVSLYDDPVASEPGNRLWTGKQQVFVDAGRFHLLLGSDPANPLPAALVDGMDLFVGVKVGSDAEMMPRVRVASVPFALKADDAVRFGGRTPDAWTADLAKHTHAFSTLEGTLGETQLPAGAVLEAELAVALAGKSDAGHLHDERYSPLDHGHDGAYVNENQADSITTGMVKDRTLMAQDLGDFGCAAGQVLEWDPAGGWGCGNDADTTYQAGSGLKLAGGVFTVDQAAVQGWCYDSPAELYAVLDERYPAAGHAHDDRYYTDKEIDGLLTVLASQYYTSTQTDLLLAAKAAKVHAHPVTDVTGLQTALDAKADKAHAHALAEVGIPATCSPGQVVKLVAGAWQCAADDTASQSAVEGWARGVCFDTAQELVAALPSWDQKASDDLVLTTAFGGDLTGTFDNLQVGTGAIGAAEIADATKYLSVRDSLGTEQFAVTDGNPAIQFAGLGGTTVSFDAANRRVTFTTPSLNKIVNSLTVGGGLVASSSVGDIQMTLDRPVLDTWYSKAGHTHATGDLDSGVLPVERGGTGGATAGAARTALGVAASGVNTDLKAIQGLASQNAIQVGPWGTAAGNTGEARFLELAAGGTNYAGLKAPDALAGNTVYTLPVAFPSTAGQVLSSTTAGVLSWTSTATGTVSSVGLSLPPQFTVTGSPVTATGTLSAAWASQTANTVLAAPAGSAGAPVFRTLTASDIPALDAAKLASGVLGVPRGGTGLSTCATGDLVVATATDTFGRLAAVAAGNVLRSGGTGTVPSWGKVSLTGHVSDVLPVGSGGTGLSAPGSAGTIAYGTGTGFGFTAQGTAGQFLKSGGTGSPTWGALAPEDLPWGANGYIRNQAVTVQEADLNIDGMAAIGTRVGIGTTSPGARLDIQGGVISSQTEPDAALRVVQKYDYTLTGDRGLTGIEIRVDSAAAAGGKVLTTSALRGSMDISKNGSGLYAGYGLTGYAANNSNETVPNVTGVLGVGSSSSAGGVTTAVGVAGEASGWTGPIQTGYGGRFSAYSTKAATNVGIYASASGGAANYAALFMGGNVGVGTTTPDTLLTVNGDTRMIGNASVSGSLLVAGSPVQTALVPQVPRGNVTTTVDSAGTVGMYSSLTIGADGLPVVAFYDTGAGNLKVAKCQNAACSSSAVVTVVSAGNVGSHSAIAVGPDGLPILSHFDLDAGDLKVTKCATPGCTGTPTTTTVDAGTSGAVVGLYTSLLHGTDGLPVISYFDYTNKKLKVAKCTKADCTGTSTISVAASGANTGLYTSVAIGVDGFPVSRSTMRAA